MQYRVALALTQEITVNAKTPLEAEQKARAATGWTCAAVTSCKPTSKLEMLCYAVGSLECNHCPAQESCKALAQEDMSCGDIIKAWFEKEEDEI